MNLINFLGMNLIERYNVLSVRREKLISERELLKSSVIKSIQKMDKVQREQELITLSLQAFKDVKPLLSAHSIDQCEKLANTALQVIFDTDSQVKYNSEEGIFMIVDSEGNEVSLRDDVGGGMVAVISFVFNLFLLMKTKKRLLLFFDEAFTQISKEYIVQFYEFLRQLCKDLKVDVMCISHDARVEDHMVDHLYRIEDGVSVKIK